MYAKGCWILEGHNPVPCHDLLEWGRWMETSELRRVAQDEKGGIRVSTVFLGLDYGFGGPSPILFETMIFGGPHDQYQERYTLWDEAVAGHIKACELAEIETSLREEQ